MKKTFVKVIATILALLLLALPTVGCSSGEPLMTLDGEALSVNLYELMLSIQKGNMAYMINYWYGDPNSEDFWGTVIDENSTTCDDYYTLGVYKKAKNLLAVSVLFKDMGLSLPDSMVDEIDEEIDKLIENDGGGSKRALNSILSQYGVNVDMYREYKLLEAKSQYLAQHLYGTGGSKIGAALKEEYLQENYVAFRQILLANYYYVFETDENGDTVYFTDNGAIAYDTEKGTPKVGADGKFVYYTEDGRIAYDTVTGKRAPVFDENGEQKTAFYTDEQKKERLDLALELMDIAGKDAAVFESLREAYSDEIMAGGALDDALCYLATNVNYESATTEYKMLDQIAEALTKIEVGETAIVSTDAGYHIVRRYAAEQGAYADSDLSRWFSDSTYGVFDFINNLENKLILTVLAPYTERIESDDELLDSISLKTVAPNYYYR